MLGAFKDYLLWLKATQYEHLCCLGVSTTFRVISAA